MEYVLRSSLLTLLRTPHATLLDLHRLLVDLPFRQQIVSRLTDPQLLQFWYKEFGTYTDTFHLPFLLRSHFQNGCLLRTNGQCSELVRG
jgi:hypothetical protein